jgi:hypothetical protein
MKALFLSILTLTLLSFMPPEKPKPQPPDPYAGCCGAEAVQFDLAGSLIFIPNLFTPNGDARNDLFKPFFDEDKVAIVSMVIKSPSEGNPVLFSLSENDLTQPYWGWFGYITQDQAHEGKFLYEMKFKAKATGEEKTIVGSACSAVCKGSEKLPIYDVSTKCFFPAQYRKKAVLSESPLDNEIECLKP